MSFPIGMVGSSVGRRASPPGWFFVRAWALWLASEVLSRAVQVGGPREEKRPGAGSGGSARQPISRIVMRIGRKQSGNGLRESKGRKGAGKATAGIRPTSSLPPVHFIGPVGSTSNRPPGRVASRRTAASSVEQQNGATILPESPSYHH